VHIVSEYNRPTGVAFVEFNSPQDAGRGMAKDRQMMGNRYVEIFHSSPQEMSRFVQRY
jgi:heterogeneous nuclear ribonucleoprotein F/H